MTDPPSAQPDPAKPADEEALAAPDEAHSEAEPRLDAPAEASAQLVAEHASEQADDPPIEAHPAPPAKPLKPPPRFARVAWHESESGWIRVVIVAWCVWLMGAWVMAWVTDTSVPRVRWMLFAGSFGLMLVWPAFRLSERTRGAGVGKGTLVILMEWLALIGVYQAVIWSLNFIALWPVMRGIWLDIAIVSWSLLTALIVATARLWPSAWARVLGMLVCIALVFGEPVLVWASVVLTGGEGWSMTVSPIQAFWELTRPEARSPVSPWSEHALVVALVAIAGWLALGMWALGEALVDKRLADRAQA